MVSKIVTKNLTVTKFVTIIIFIKKNFIQRISKVMSEIEKINEIIEKKEEALRETRAKYKKEREEIFSSEEIKKQKNLFKQSKGCYLGLLVGILGIAFFAFPELENGSSGKGIIFVIGSIILGVIIQKIKNYIFSKMVKKEEYEKYLNIEKEEKEAIKTILESIEDSKLDRLEISAKEKRANKLFIGTGLDNSVGLYFCEPEKIEFTIDGINYGNIKGVASFPVTPGRHVVTAKYLLKVSKGDNR